MGRLFLYDHFEELPQHAFAEWAPMRLATPAVCALSLITPASMLVPAEWPIHVLEQNLNYCLAHGYRFTLFLEKLVGQPWPVHWSKPRASHLVAQRPECSLVFFLDADAVVHNVSLSLGLLAARFFSSETAPPHVLMSSHRSRFRADLAGGDGSAYRECACGRAAAAERCSGGQLMTELSSRFACSINSGAYLLRNTNASRAILSFWAGGGDGRCHVRSMSRSHEQDCTHKLKAKYPSEVDVVDSGGAQNTDSRNTVAVRPSRPMHRARSCVRLTRPTQEDR